MRPCMCVCVCGRVYGHDTRHMYGTYVCGKEAQSRVCVWHRGTHTAQDIGRLQPPLVFLGALVLSHPLFPTIPRSSTRSVPVARGSRGACGLLSWAPGLGAELFVLTEDCVLLADMTVSACVCVGGGEAGGGAAWRRGWSGMGCKQDWMPWRGAWSVGLCVIIPSIRRKRGDPGIAG